MTHPLTPERKRPAPSRLPPRPAPIQSMSRFFFFFSSRRRHTRCLSDWSSDVCSSDLIMWKVPAIIIAPKRSTIGEVWNLHDDPLASGWVEAIDQDASRPAPDQLIAEIGRASCRERV